MEEQIEFPEPPFDRQKVRALVEAQGAETHAAIVAGGNPFHLNLDHQDRIEEFKQTLSDEDRAVFEKFYAEEMEARTRALNLEADRLERETAGMNAQLATQDAAAEALRPFVTGVLIAILIAVLIWSFSG